MLFVFAKNQPLVMILLPIILVAHLLMGLTFPFFDISDNIDPNIFKFSFHFDGIIGYLLTIGFIFLNAYLINLIFNSNQFYRRYTYLPSYFYVLISLSFPYSNYFTGDSLAHTFIILVFLQVYKLNQNQSGKSNTFNAGLFLSLASICNPIYGVFLPCLLICIRVIRPFVFREYLLLLVGVILPVFYVFAVYPGFYISLIDFILNKHFEGNIGWVFLGILSAVAVFVFLGLIGLIKYSGTSSIRFKKLRNILLYFLFFGGLTLLVITLFGGSVFYASILVVPVSLLLPYAHLALKIKKPINLLAWGVLIIGFAKFFI